MSRQWNRKLKIYTIFFKTYFFELFFFHSYKCPLELHYEFWVCGICFIVISPIFMSINFRGLDENQFQRYANKTTLRSIQWVKRNGTSMNVKYRGLTYLNNTFIEVPKYAISMSTVVDNCYSEDKYMHPYTQMIISLIT